MRRALLTPPLLALAVIIAGPTRGQTAGGPAADPAQTPPAAATPGPAPPPPALARAVSPEVAAKLAATAPKFVPPKSDADQPAPDRRELDKPRNGIVRLPSYIVQEPKMRDLKERELLTPKGRLDLALKRYPGLRFNPLFFLGSNNGIALAMLEEEERLERMKEMADLMDLFRYSETPVSDDVKRNAQQTFIRSDGWVETGGQRSGPHN